MLRCLESIGGESSFLTQWENQCFHCQVLQNSIYVQLEFEVWPTFLLLFYFFSHTFFFFWPMPLFMIYWCKMSSGFLMGDRVATQHALLSVYDLKSRCLVPDSPGTLTEDLVSQWLWCASVICVVIREQKSKKRSLSFTQFFQSVQTFLLEFQLCR